MQLGSMPRSAQPTSRLPRTHIPACEGLLRAKWKCTQSPSTPCEACFRFPRHRIFCTNGPEPTFKALGWVPLGSQVATVQLFVSTRLHSAHLGWECVCKPPTVCDKQEWGEEGLGCRSRTGFPSMPCFCVELEGAIFLGSNLVIQVYVSREEDSTYLIWQCSVS